MTSSSYSPYGFFTSSKGSFWLAASAAAAALFTSSPAGAQTLSASPRPAAYAIFVGSNAGGPGQKTLRFAEDDAKRVSETMKELGRFGSTDFRVLLHPDKAHLFSELTDMAAKLKSHKDRGEQAVAVFYYSGHARANAINLGAEEVPLAQLREKIASLDSTLTLAVLDACQSGAISHVKGASPAADFSYNSITHLTTRGLALMASSTAEELSQESDELKGSYFTHHLLVGLRGAGDLDRDGRVSLDEAYRYAYRNTLASTARTQVGGQHVTLETELSGKGDLAVTYPAEDHAQLELPEAMEAAVLVQRKVSGAIYAEVQKAKGAKVRIALPAGGFDVIVREPHRALSCDVTLTDNQVTPLTLQTCREIPLRTTVAKGEGPAVGSELERWGLEAALGLSFGRENHAYTERLKDFGFANESGATTGRVSVALTRKVVPHLHAVLSGTTLTGENFRRAEIGLPAGELLMSSYGVGAYLRAVAQPHPVVSFYGQAGGGIGIASVRISGDNIETKRDTYASWLLGGHAGALVTPSDYFGVFSQVGYEFSPTVTNLLGDVRESGGPSVILGVRFQGGNKI